jgi:hypothetical protein
MHLEENLNGSYFKKSVVENAIHTLANTPILAYIEENANEEEDFSDHRLVLERKNDDIKLSYNGSAIGVIPENNNAHFDKKVCDDGIEREFLVCNGLVWTKWETPLEIFERDLIKGQSMELADQYAGFFNADGYFEFTEFSFFGACCLGEGVMPAMRSSTIAVKYTVDEIQTKLQQFTNFMSQSSENEVDINNSSKGGTEMEDNKDIVVEETTEEIVEEVVETITEEPVVETVEVEETTEETQIESVDEVEEETIEDNIIQEEIVEETTTDFSQELKDLQSQYDILLNQFNEYKENYSTSKDDVDELITYKNKKMEEERSASETNLFDKFEERIGNTTEFSELKANARNYSLTELEKECIYIVGLHTEYAKETKKQENLKFSVEKDTDETKEVYGDLFKKFKKD